MVDKVFVELETTKWTTYIEYKKLCSREIPIAKPYWSVDREV